MRLPINRKVDESHHAMTPDGLSVWYTIQVSPHARIQEAIFERADRMPSDEECVRWLGLLIVGGHANEAPSFPGQLGIHGIAPDQQALQVSAIGLGATPVSGSVRLVLEADREVQGTIDNRRLANRWSFTGS